MYRALSARYGFTPQAIAEMTPDQQMMYFEDGTDPGTGRPYVTFNTAREAQAYMQRMQES